MYLIPYLASIGKGLVGFMVDLSVGEMLILSNDETGSKIEDASVFIGPLETVGWFDSGFDFDSRCDSIAEVHG